MSASQLIRSGLVLLPRFARVTRAALVAASFASLTGCLPAAPRGDFAGAVRSATGADGLEIRLVGRPSVDEGEPASRLTLADAIARGVRTDSKLQQALARVKLAESEADQARLLPNPVLSLVVRLREGGGSPIITPAVAIDLVSILQRPRSMSAADHGLRGAAADALTAALDVVADVQKAYVDAQAQDAMLAVLKLRQQVVSRLVGNADARLKAGGGSRLDVLTLQAQLVSIDQEMADAQLDRQAKRLALLRKIGCPSGALDIALDRWPDAASPTTQAATQPYGVVPSSPATQPAAGSIADAWGAIDPNARDPYQRVSESAWLKSAMAHRPEIQAGRWELVALDDKKALTAFFPWTATETGVEAERDQQWSVGPAIVAPLPVFDTGASARDGAIARQLEARHKLNESFRQVVEETRRGYYTYQSAMASLHRTTTQLEPLQVKRREQVEAAYKAGEVDLATFLLAEGDLHEVREKLVELRRKAATARIDLQRAAGGAGYAAELDRTGNAPAPPDGAGGATGATTP